MIQLATSETDFATSETDFATDIPAINVWRNYVNQDKSKYSRYY